MKLVLPAIGSIAAVALFAFSTTYQSAIAVERPAYDDTFEQLELFADVLARVRSQYVVEVDDSALIEDAMNGMLQSCLLYTSPSPRDGLLSRMPSSA